MSYLDEAGTVRVAAAARAFGSAQPFPHLVVDGVLRPEIASALASGFPPVDAQLWKHHLHRNAHKFACNRQEAMPALFRQVVAELNAPPFLRVLEEVTGIGPLLADPDLEGGGLHQIQAGGFLKVHADFNVHPRSRLHRRLNLLVYLNPVWDEAWDGNLELWAADLSGCRRSIAPVLNRAVLFSTTDLAFHGHPRPLRTPSGVTRKSLALYYYTQDRPAAERAPAHSTLYRHTAGEAPLAHLLRLAPRYLFSSTAPRQLFGSAVRRFRGRP